jgi:T5SS/PEP-CTERM-associated repeat protein
MATDNAHFAALSLLRPSAATRLLAGGALAAALLLLGAPAARADVVGIGDIIPAKADPNDPTATIPDLPQFGNSLATAIPLIVVGGTGQNVGGTAAAQMTIDIPSDTDPLFSGAGIIGDNIFGLGLVRVVSLNSEWQMTGTLTVGNDGQGFLEVIAGARVTTDSAAAGPTNPSEDQYDLVLGGFEGSQGFALVDGFASLLLSTNMSVGHRSLGRVEMINRGRMVTLNEASVGTVTESIDNAVGNGDVLVDGQGTRWVVGLVESSNPNSSPPDSYDGMLTVGLEGRGTVEIRNQGWVQVETDTLLGDRSGSHGEVIVTGQNSQLWTLENLAVGNATGTATGELRIGDRAIARADGRPGSATEATVVGPRGLVELTGGTLFTPDVKNDGVIRGSGRIESPVVTNFGDIRNAASVADQRERLWFTGTVTNNDNIESIGGEMEFEGEVTNQSPDGDIFGVDAIFRFRGGLINNSRLSLDNTVVEALAITNNAAMAVGSSDTSFVLGDVDFGGSSVLSMTLGDDFSHLSVTGDANLGGTLEVLLDSGFQPVVGQSFEIITAGAVNNTFNNLVISPLTSGVSWSLQYLTTKVILEALSGPVISGDFDGSGVVDAADLAIWKQNFGLTPATLAQGDANGDGVVDGGDFFIWQQQLGTSPVVAATAPAAGAVPEPTAAALALAAFAPLCRRRRK